MGQQSFRGDFRGMFLDALRASLEVPALSSRFLKLFEEESSRLYATAIAEIRPTHVESCAVFAAAYTALRDQGVAAPYTALSSVLDSYGAEITAFTRNELDESSDPFTRIVQISKDREADYFGVDFGFERPRDDRQAYHLHITRCAYARLFTAWGFPELTGLFCRLDEAWIRAVDPARHGVSFERPSTIGQGGQRCLFLFDRVRPR